MLRDTCRGDSPRIRFEWLRVERAEGRSVPPRAFDHHGFRHRGQAERIIIELFHHNIDGGGADCAFALINAGKKRQLNEPEMIAAAQIRPDLQLILDVTVAEPPPADSLLYTLPNIILTPHIAGSNGYECARLGEAMVGELRRFAEGGPLHYELLSSSADWVA